MTELGRRGFAIAGASVAAAPLLRAVPTAGQARVREMSQDGLDHAYDQRRWASDPGEVQRRYTATSAANAR